MVSPASDQGGLREELRGDAQAVTDTAKERLHSEVDSRKGEAASQAKTLSSALEDVAGKLDPNTPTWLKSALEQGARSIQRLAEGVEQKDSRQLTRDVTQFARQNPGTFLAGCALVGFAAARVFKAGATGTAAPATSAGSYPTPPAQRYALDNNETVGIQTHDAGAASAGFPAQRLQPVT
ncbi:MAG: hypothetical protein ABW194_06220 [Novosphingobium sp.]